MQRCEGLNRVYINSLVGSELILVKIKAPYYVYRKILSQRRQGTYKGIIKDLIKKSDVIWVFIKNCPKGWWVALRILRESPGKLYILKEVNYMDVPSKVIELSAEYEWKPEYEEMIKKELEGWGLSHE